MLLNIGNDSRDRRSHSCTKNLPIVGAVVCKLRDFEAKRQQMNYILHGQRSSLSQGRVSFESLLRNFNDKVNGDFGEQQNNVKRCQFVTSIKNFIPREICKFAGIFVSIISIPNNRWQNSPKITRNYRARLFKTAISANPWLNRLVAD